MTHIVAETTLASAVAQNGTFNVSYPSGYNAGSFASYGHEMFAAGLQAHFKQDNGELSISFGASNATVTYKGSTSIPADSRITLQLNIAGGPELPDTLQGVERAVAIPTTRIDLGAADAADSDGVAASQSVSASGSFSLNGALVNADGDAEFDVPRNVVAAWTTTSVLTITGEDEYGNTLVEQSASGTSHTGTKAFKKVTSVTSSASITGATVGSGDVLGLPIYVSAVDQILAEFEDGEALNGGGGSNLFLADRMLEAAVDAGTAHNIVCPVDGRIIKLTTICQAGVTTGGDITVEVNTVAVDGLTVAVASGAAEGEVDSDTPTEDHATAVVSEGDRIEIIPASAFNGSADIYFVLEIEPDQDQNGTFVAGDQTTPTATTGDVRGTYAPATTPDGSTYFSLLVNAPDPTYKGVAQYTG
jgi:hypothetical protein